MKSDGPTYYERNWVWILLAFAATIPVVVYGNVLSRRSNNNSIRQWLPDDLPATQVYNFFTDHFGTDEFAMVSWEGCSLDDPRLIQFAKLVSEHQDEEGDKLFSKIVTGPQLLKKLQDKPFDLQADVAFKRLKGVLIGHDDNSTCSVVELTEKGDDNRRISIEALRKIATEDVKIPAADLHMAGDAVTNAEVDIASESAIGSLVVYCMIIAISCAYISLRNVKLVIIIFVVALYSSTLAEALVPFLGGRMNLVLVVMPVLVYVLGLSAGIHIVNYHEDVIKESGPAGAPLKAIQNGWLPCTLAAATTAIGLASLSVSHIRPVKDFGTYSAIGILASLVVVFLLLPALLLLRNRLEQRKDRKRSAAATSENSTVSGFDRFAEWSDRLFDRFIRWFGNRVIDHHASLVLVCVSILVFVGWGAMYINTSVKPARFFEDDSRLVTDYIWLAEADRFGSQVPLEVVVAFDRKQSPHTVLEQMQLVNAVQGELTSSASDFIDSTMSACTFAPDLAASHYEKYTMNKRLAANRTEYGKVNFYSYEGPDGRPTPLPQVPTVKDPDGKPVSLPQDPKVGRDLWRISARVARVELDYDIVIDQVHQRVDSFLVQRSEERAKRRADIRQAQEKLEQTKIAKLAEFAEQRAACQGSVDEAACLKALAKAEQEYSDALSKLTKNLNNAFARAVDDTVGVDVIYTGMVPLFHEAQRELLDGLFKSFLIAFALIAGVMMVWFKSPSAGLITMLPNVFPAAVIFGWMGWTNRIVDIGSMMTASVAMGIAVDDTVHFLTWFRRGLQQNMSQREALMHAYHRCALAMTQTTMIAGLGLVVFSMSTFQPVSQFGLLMFVLLAAALLGDLIFLPALLASPVGKLFRPKPEAEPVVSEPQPVA